MGVLRLQLIQSRQNQIIKNIISLKDKKNRRKSGSFLIEGFRFVQEAIISDAEIECICVSADAAGKFSAEIEGLLKENTKAFEVSPELFRKISETESPQGILAVVGIPDRSLSSIYHKGFRGLVLDSVQDPGNAGMMVRSAHALGFDAVMASSGTVDIFNDKTLRATMGSIFRIPVFDNINESDIFSFCMENGLRIIVSRLEDAKPCFDTELTGDFVLVIGNEGKGVSASMQKNASEFVYIPMPGGAESLNAAAAASIIMYESCRQSLRFKP